MQSLKDERYWAMVKFASVDDYLASLPDEQRAVMEEIERRVLAVYPTQTG